MHIPKNQKHDNVTEVINAVSLFSQIFDFNPCSIFYEENKWPS